METENWLCPEHGIHSIRSFFLWLFHMGHVQSLLKLPSFRITMRSNRSLRSLGRAKARPLA